MPDFLVNDNGKKYKITAPDQAAAFDAFKRFKGGTQGAPSGGKISLLDQMRKQTGQDRPQAPVDASRNPMNSPLPGPLGQLANTIQAATEGGMQASTLNMGDEIAAGVGAPFRAAYDASQGNGFDVGRAFKYNLGQNEKIGADVAALNPEANQVGQFAGTLGLMGKARAGGAATPAVPKALPFKAALGSGATGAIMGAGEPGSIEDRLKNGLWQGGISALAGAGVGKVASSLAGPARAATPTVDGLFKQATAGFKAAENSGAVVAQPAASQIGQNMRALLTKRGLITPNGKVANYPAVAHALNLAEDFGQKPMTMGNLFALRERLGDAAGSVTKAERDVGVKMIKQLDDFVEGLPPQAFIRGDGQAAIRNWAGARQIWHVAEKGKSVEGLTASARRQSQKSAAVPMEQATRNKFDAFIGKDKNVRGYSPAEREALARVANGTPVGNTAKAVGRLAPTTLASLTFKGGAPFMVGNAIGGPVVGAAAAGTTLGLGGIGRFISNLSTKQNAELARVLVLNGGKVPKTIPRGLSAPVSKALGNLILTGGSGSAQIGDQLIRMLSAKPQTVGQPAS